MSVSKEGVLLVVSGPSGVGKGTLIDEVLKHQPSVRKSVSCTTRAPRAGEREGEDYYFVTADEFARMREAGELLEWAAVHQDLLYGTPREPVEAALAEGQDIVLEIDYQGARSVREQLGNAAVLVFVAPPSWQVLMDRLRGRDTESEEAVTKRVASAQTELANIGMFDYIIINDTIKGAASELEAILIAERNTLSRCDWEQLQQHLLEEAGQ